MFISYGILAAMVSTLIILNIKCPDKELQEGMRLLLPLVFGFLLYIPVLSMLMDIFICTQQANRNQFFDIDCNTECWDSHHIAHVVFASVALVQVIPAGFYLRMKY